MRKPLYGKVQVIRGKWKGWVRPEKVRDEDVILQFVVGGVKVKFEGVHYR